MGDEAHVVDFWSQVVQPQPLAPQPGLQPQPLAPQPGLQSVVQPQPGLQPQQLAPQPGLQPEQLLELLHPKPQPPDVVTNSRYRVEKRWTKRLSGQFCPVSSYFLRNYHRLRPNGAAQGLTSTEAMALIQIMDHKWDERAPWPTIGALATRLGVSERTVRATIKRLEDLTYIKREYAPHGGPNRYHLEGLFSALEAMMDADLAAEDKAAETAVQEGAAS